MDARLRSLEREGADDLRWLTEALRVGRVTRERTLAAAHLGHAAARAWWVEGSVLRPRWSHDVLPPWTLSSRSLTERVGDTEDQDERRTLLRSAAAQAALGRLELPQLPPHPVQGGLRVLRLSRQDDACLLLHWLASVTLDGARVWLEDLAAVAGLVATSSLVPPGPSHVEAARLRLPLSGGRRAWCLEGWRVPHLPLLLESEAELVIVDQIPRITSTREARYSPFRARAARALDALGEARKAEGLQAKADGLAELGAVDEAEQVLTAGLERLPSDLELFLARARLRAAGRAHVAAAEDFGDAARREPRPAYRADWLVEQAQALLDGGRPGDALAPLEAARRLRSDSGTLTLLARARRLTGDTARARTAAKDALARAPANEEVRHEAWLAGLVS